MLDNVLRIATRQSPLALWQAHYVKQRLEACHTGLRVELVPMVTRGDVILDTPLAKVGGKGLFVKELELALLENRADIAVHSMKDVPVEFPEGLGLVTICEREEPRDAFVSNRYDSLDALPAGSVVGTSSLRRQCQLAERRPDLVIRSLRGNVGTRLGKLDNGDYDAIIIGHSQFEKIPMSVERQRAILEQQIDEIMMGISEAKREKAENFTIKQMMKTQKGLQTKIDKLNDQSRKDDVVTFEELGVDRIFIDESHYFKNRAKRCA